MLNWRSCRPQQLRLSRQLECCLEVVTNLGQTTYGHTDGNCFKSNKHMTIYGVSCPACHTRLLLLLLFLPTCIVYTSICTFSVVLTYKIRDYKRLSLISTYTSSQTRATGSMGTDNLLWIQINCDTGQCQPCIHGENIKSTKYDHRVIV